MIRISELSFGNIVKIGDNIHRVIEIYGNKDMVRLNGREFTTYTVDLEPVPITDEILHKNGFKNISDRIDREIDNFESLYELNDNVVLGKHDDTFEICYEHFNGEWDVYDHHPVLAMKYIHELQNTLKDLRIDKMIVL